MKKILAIFMALSIYTASAWAIEGVYDLTGYNPYWQTEYTGTVVINKDKNDVYQARWIVEEDISFGTGLKRGHTVSFAFKAPKPATRKEEGVIVYKIEHDTLVGTFVYSGQSLIGTEKLVKKRVS